MKKRTVSFEYEIYPSLESLPESDRKLLREAREALKGAYAPYSRFRVGAAVLLENDKIVTGNNQENAAYPNGLCGERVALFSASAQYPGIAARAIAIASSHQRGMTNRPASPCGGCRQALLEFENRYKKPVRIILAGDTGPIHVFQAASHLLPLAFTAEYLD